MSARRRFLGALLALPAMPLVAKLPVAAPVTTMKPKSIDASRSRLRGAGVRLNARLARRALVRKIRDAQARDERSR